MNKLNVQDKSQYFCSFMGAYCATYAINDSFSVLHTPAGCHRRALHLWGVHDALGNTNRGAATNLAEKDAVFGNENKLKKVILDAEKRLHPKLISVLTSCTPEIIGDDVQGVITSIKNKIKNDIIYIPSAGFTGDFIDGYSNVLRGIAEQLVQEKQTKNKSVNIVGYLFDRYEFDCIGDINELRRVLSLLKIQTNSIFLEGGPISRLTEAGRAEFNIVFPYGKEAAKILEKKHKQTNLFCDIPIGIDDSKRFITEIAKLFKKKAEAKEIVDKELYRIIPLIQTVTQYTFGKKVALFADPTRIVGLTNFFVELGMEPTIIGITRKEEKIDKNLIQKLKKHKGLFDSQIITNPNREETQKIFKEEPLDLVVGSCFESWDSSPFNIPNIQLTMPAFEEHILFPQPIIGFNGAVSLSQKIGNIFAKGTGQRLSMKAKLDRLNRNKY